MFCPRCRAQNSAHARFCNSCGFSFPSTPPSSGATTGPTYNLNAPPDPSPPQQIQPIQHIYIQQPLATFVPPSKPGNVQAIGIMCLVDGILNLGWGLGLMSTICLAPLGIYAFVLGILEIIYATKLLGDPITAKSPNRTIAWMQIANIITGDLISLTIGIISLVFYNDSKVEDYFRSIAAHR